MPRAPMSLVLTAGLGDAQEAAPVGSAAGSFPEDRRRGGRVEAEGEGRGPLGFLDRPGGPFHEETQRVKI